jgi:hypothetical protein
MATRQDFSDDEWAHLQKGVTGSAMLVSLSDRDFTDTFGEVGAMTKYLAGQQAAAASGLVRELAKTHSTGFGLTTSPAQMHADTMEAIQASIALSGKAPDEVGAVPGPRHGRFDRRRRGEGWRHLSGRGPGARPDPGGARGCLSPR